MVVLLSKFNLLQRFLFLGALKHKSFVAFFHALDLGIVGTEWFKKILSIVGELVNKKQTKEYLLFSYQ